MRRIGDYNFPEQGNKEECANWKPVVIYKALATRVLCVATTRIEGGWSAYCDAVPGLKHVAELSSVLSGGDPLRPAVAKSLFPEFDGIPYHY